jgi:predicted site-specific integrase-resolvase
MREEPILYNDSELCRLLRISRVTSYRLRRKGALKFLKMDSGIRYTVQHVADFIRSREQGATPANEGRAEQ